MPTRREASLLDERLRRRRPARGRSPGSWRCARSRGRWWRAGGAGEVVEAQAQHHGAPDPRRGPHPAGHPVDELDEHGVELGRPWAAPAERALRPDRAAAAADLHGARVAVVGEGVEVAARTPTPSIDDQRRLAEQRDLADALDAPGVQLRAP